MDALNKAARQNAALSGINQDAARIRSGDTAISIPATKPAIAATAVTEIETKTAANAIAAAILADTKAANQPVKPTRPALIKAAIALIVLYLHGGRK